jgi:hypothetical protein
MVHHLVALIEEVVMRLGRPNYRLRDGGRQVHFLKDRSPPIELERA